MKKKSSALVVKKVYETYKSDKRMLVAELKNLIREGQKTGDAAVVGAAYSYLADICQEAGDLNGGVTNALKAVALLNDTEEYDLTAKSYITLGNFYALQENRQMSLIESDRAYRIVKRRRIKGKTGISAMYNLANCYSNLGDYKSSVRYLTECIDAAKAEFPENYTSLAAYTLDLANDYKRAGKPGKAKDILDSMLSWIGKIEYDPLYCDYFLRRAILNYELKNADSGDSFLDEALDHIPEKVYPVRLYENLRKITHILAEKGDKVRAKKIYELMKRFEKHSRDYESRLISTRMFAEYCSRSGEPERAMEYYRKADELYERRQRESNGIQLDICKSMRNADAEIDKMKLKMKANEALFTLEPMTKLLNRSALLTVSSDFIEKAAKKKQKIGAIFIDIDNFKECNDKYGRAKGDEIISTVAAACRDEQASNIKFARYGGDEFFGITRGLSDSEVAAVAQRICRRIREADVMHEKNPKGRMLTVSVGVVNVSITDSTDTIIEIANYADKAVYYAKNAGKNSIYMLNYNSAGNKGNNASFEKIEFLA